MNSAQEKRSLSIGPGLVAYAAAATVYGHYLKPGLDMPELTRSSWEEIEGEGDRFVGAEGPAKGMKGFFRRDPAGHVDGVHLGGRMATRVPAAV